MSGRFVRVMLVIAVAFMFLSQSIPAQDLPKLEEALNAIEPTTSSARQRLLVRKVIRDVQKAIEAATDQATRWPLLEFLFRAQQKLVKLDDDPKHRADIIETCRELVNAPDDFAALRLKPDLLISQIEQVKKGNSPSERAKALRLGGIRWFGPFPRHVGVEGILISGATILPVATHTAHENGSLSGGTQPEQEGVIATVGFEHMVLTTTRQMQTWPVHAESTDNGFTGIIEVIQIATEHIQTPIHVPPQLRCLS